MAHDKVYGICENKCFVEGLSKAEIESRMGALQTTLESKVNVNTIKFINQYGDEFNLTEPKPYFIVGESRSGFDLINLTLTNKTNVKFAIIDVINFEYHYLTPNNHKTTNGPMALCLPIKNS